MPGRWLSCRVARVGMALLAATAFSILGGCNSSEQFASLEVKTNLPPGTSVTLETAGQTLTYQPVEIETVDSNQTIEYARLIPGEYRLTMESPPGTLVILELPFGVNPGQENTLDLLVSASFLAQLQGTP